MAIGIVEENKKGYEYFNNLNTQEQIEANRDAEKWVEMNLPSTWELEMAISSAKNAEEAFKFENQGNASKKDLARQWFENAEKSLEKCRKTLNIHITIAKEIRDVCMDINLLKRWVDKSSYLKTKKEGAEKGIPNLWQTANAVADQGFLHIIRNTFFQRDKYSKEMKFSIEKQSLRENQKMLRENSNKQIAYMEKILTKEPAPLEKEEDTKVHKALWTYEREAWYVFPYKNGKHTGFNHVIKEWLAIGIITAITAIICLFTIPGEWARIGWTSIAIGICGYNVTTHMSWLYYREQDSMIQTLGNPILFILVAILLPWTFYSNPSASEQMNTIFWIFLLGIGIWFLLMGYWTLKIELSIAVLIIHLVVLWHPEKMLINYYKLGQLYFQVGQSLTDRATASLPWLFNNAVMALLTNKLYLFGLIYLIIMQLKFHDDVMKGQFNNT